MSNYDGANAFFDQVEDAGVVFDFSESPVDDGSAYDCGGIIEQVDAVDDGSAYDCGGIIEQVDEVDWSGGLSMGLGPEDGENGEYFN